MHSWSMTSPVRWNGDSAHGSRSTIYRELFAVRPRTMPMNTSHSG